MAKGNSNEAESKLQFYPTDILETYRILGVLSSRQSTRRNLDITFREEYGAEKHKELYAEFLDLEQQRKRPDFASLRYEAMLREDRYSLINKYIEMDLGFTKGVTVADLFAGEGSWLKLFKQLSNTNILIGNELEEGRYKTMVEDDLMDYHYNLAFEELQLPKKIINVMLFNPPYGVSNGENNVRRYLRMTLDRDLMAKDGIIVMVIKKRDALLCADLIAQHFNSKVLCYKTNNEEYDKWGQVVLYATIKDKPLNLNNINDVASYKQIKEEIENLINADFEFEMEYYQFFRHTNYKIVDIKKAFENFQYMKNNIKFESNKNDKAWKWILRETEVKDLSEEILTIPKKFKSGELCNVIASGKINGELSLTNNIGRHVVVGGVKTVTNERKITIDDKKTGGTVDKLETTVQSVPYLNLLISENGKLKIKELKAESGDDNDTLSKN